MERARIFNIERCSTEDGPGIRTTVFLKGCHLRCRWCANPESQKFRKEILWKAVKCIGCRKCMEVCPEKAVSFDPEYGIVTDQKKCKVCGACVDACYQEARVLQGEDFTVDELMSILARDEHYYLASGGGITFSGGEPLLYPAFIQECSSQMHKRGWTVLVETCGEVPLTNIQETADGIDIIYCDYKHFSSDRHEELTGRGNEQIIKNIYWLDKNFQGELCLRYPYIPGCNVLQNEVNMLDYLIDQGKKRGMKIVLNPSPYDRNIERCDLRKVDLFFVNEVEAGQITGKSRAEEMLWIMREMYPESGIVLTLGDKGAYYSDRTITYYQEAFKVDAIDTTAAGDTFTGYFLASYINDQSGKKALMKAAVASSMAVERKGAAVSIPCKEEVEIRLQTIE